MDWWDQRIKGIWILIGQRLDMLNFIQSCTKLSKILLGVFRSEEREPRVGRDQTIVFQVAVSFL